MHARPRMAQRFSPQAGIPSLAASGSLVWVPLVLTGSMEDTAGPPSLNDTRGRPDPCFLSILPRTCFEGAVRPEFKTVYGTYLM